MSSRQAKIQEDTNFRIMRILQENPDLTQRELANHLGISLGGLNYCLNALIDKGLVKMQNFQNSKNKFSYVYLLTPQGVAEKVAMTSRFLGRKIEEYEALKVEINALKSEMDVPGIEGKQKAWSTWHRSSSALARDQTFVNLLLNLEQKQKYEP